MIDIDAMIASNLPACSAGMMPSQSSVTNSQVTFISWRRRIGDVDVEAFELAVGGQVRLKGEVGAFGADLQRGLRRAGRLWRSALVCGCRRGFCRGRCGFRRVRRAPEQAQREPVRVRQEQPGPSLRARQVLAAGSAGFSSCEQAASISASAAAEAASVKRFIVSI